MKPWLSVWIECAVDQDKDWEPYWWINGDELLLKFSEWQWGLRLFEAKVFSVLFHRCRSAGDNCVTPWLSTVTKAISSLATVWWFF
jgi:hypothetical protein